MRDGGICFACWRYRCRLLSSACAGIDKDRSRGDWEPITEIKDIGGIAQVVERLVARSLGGSGLKRSYSVK